MTEHQKFVNTFSPVLWQLENNPQRLMWLAKNTSWFTPAWMVPWGEGPAPDVPPISFRNSTYLEGIGKKEQIRAMDKARRQLNEWCITLIKKDIEQHKTSMGDNKGLKAAIDSILDRMYEHKVVGFEWTEEHSPKPAGMGPGIVRYQYRQHNRMIAAELSKEIKHDLMQDMLWSRVFGIWRSKARRGGVGVTWPEDAGFDEYVKSLTVGGSKKLSKYFVFIATLSGKPS